VVSGRTSPHTDDADKRRGIEHAIRMSETPGPTRPKPERNLLWGCFALAVWLLMFFVFLLTALGPHS
jgi:hypothetical protein